MAPQPTAQSMQQLLSLWAEAYGSQVAPREPEEQFSTPPSSSSRDDDDFMRQISDLLDEKFQKLEEDTFRPLLVEVQGLNRRCRQIEESLDGREAETVTVNLDGRGSNQKRPNNSSRMPTRHLSTPVSPPIGNQEMSVNDVKNAMDLLMRMSQLATASHSDTANPSSFDWAEASTTTSDAKDEGSVELESFQQTRGAKYEETDKKRVREKEIVVDADAEVVRALSPRPCHKFYLSKSGCRNPDCSHSHEYQLNKGHLKYMRQLCQSLPCQALKHGIVCKDGDDCIYRHKCPGGFNCSWGDKCRFANIPDAHPFPGDFHRKKNYYDSSKGGSPEGKEQMDGDGWFSDKKGAPKTEATSSW